MSDALRHHEPGTSVLLSNGIRRFLLIGGYTIAVLYWLPFLIALLSRRPSRFAGFSGSIHERLSDLLILAAAALLPPGIAGLQFGRCWARTVLIFYSALWLLGMVLIHAWSYVEVEVLSKTTVGTPAFRLEMTLLAIERLVRDCVFPIIVLVCVGGTEALPFRIRRLLIVGGYVLAVVRIPQDMVRYWGEQWPFSSLTSRYWTVAMMPMATVLLLAGTVGLQCRQRWARFILYGYSMVWLSGSLWLGFSAYIEWMGAIPKNSEIRLTVLRTIIVLLWRVIPNLAFPIFLAVCLRMPELIDAPRGAQRGFVPVLASDEPGTC